MFLIIFLIVGASALGSIALILYQQMRLVREGAVVVDEVLPLRRLIQNRIDWAYFHFALSFKQLIHYGYYYFLVSTRFTLMLTRYFLVRVERRCARVIDSIHGRGVLHKRGAVSLFLAEIKRPKETSVAEIGHK